MDGAYPEMVEHLRLSSVMPKAREALEPLNPQKS